MRDAARFPFRRRIAPSPPCVASCEPPSTHRRFVDIQDKPIMRNGRNTGWKLRKKRAWRYQRTGAKSERAVAAELSGSVPGWFRQTAPRHRTRSKPEAAGSFADLLRPLLIRSRTDAGIGYSYRIILPERVTGRHRFPGTVPGRQELVRKAGISIEIVNNPIGNVVCCQDNSWPERKILFFAFEPPRRRTGIEPRAGTSGRRSLRGPCSRARNGGPRAMDLREETGAF